MKKIFLLIVLTLLVSGCSANYKNLNNLGIVSSLIIDKKDDEYITYLEIYKEEKAENGSKKSSYFIKGKGSNIKDAMNEASLSLSKDLYFVHINAVILSKEAINNNLENIFNYLEKRIQLNSNYFILVSDDIKELMDTKDEDNPILGEKIKDIITNSTNNGALVEYDYLEKLYNYVNPNIDVYLNKIEVVNKNIKLNKAYTFNSQKIVDELSEEEVKLSNLVKNKNNIYLNFYKDDKYYLLKIDQSKTKYDLKNGIKLKIDISANIDSLNTNINLKDSKSIKELNNHASYSLTKRLKELLNKLQKDKTDILGIDNYIYKTYGYKKYNFFEDDIDVEVNVTINKKGLILNTIGGEYDK